MVRTFRARLPKVAMDAVLKNENEIINYYQIYQVGSNLKVGTRKTQVKIGYYAEATQEIWRESYYYTSELDKSFRNEYYMYWSGQFFAQMRIVKLGAKQYEVISTVSYFDELLRKYGDIMTFSQETKKFIEKSYIEPHIKKELSKLLQSIT